MKTEPKASPRPWAVVYDSEKDDFGVEHRWVNCITSSQHNAPVVVAEEMAEVDAEHIVRAVNAHDALVEALEKVRDRIEPCEYVELLEEVKAALALAKEEVK